MNFLAVILLSLFISVKSSNATQEDGTFHENTKTNVKSSNATQEDGTFHENTKTNGFAGLSTVFTNDTKHEGQLTRSRRSEIEEDYNSLCYLKFFLEEVPPLGSSAGKGKNIVYICQKAGLLDTPFFSTMFDLDYKIPIYSAYVLKRLQAFPDRAREKFRLEPGLKLHEQGTDLMYSNSGSLPCIHKGHLVPAQTYSFTPSSFSSTFTYTNAVPQYAKFNSGLWSSFEKRIREYKKKCSNQQNRGDLYLLTGISDIRITMSGNSDINKKTSGSTITTNKPRNTRMPEEPKAVIPNSMWTAGCCVRGKNVIGSFAVIGNNVWDKNKIFMSQLTVRDLQYIIGVFELFPGNFRCDTNTYDVTI